MINAKKICLLGIVLFLTLSKSVAQQWNFYKSLAAAYEPKEITGRANGDLFLQNRSYIYFKQPGQSQWNKLQNAGSSSFLKANWNDNVVYADYLTGITLSKYFNVTNYNAIGFIENSNFWVDNNSGFGALPYEVIIDGTNLILVTSRDMSSGIQPGVSIWKNSQYGFNTNWSSNIDESEFYITGDVLSPGNYILGSWEGTVLRSSDAGTTWSQVATQPYVFKKIKKAFGNSVYAITYETDGNFSTNYPYDDTNFFTYKIKKSNDNGVTWTDVTINVPEQRFNSLKFHSESQTLYLTGDKGIYTLNSENGSWNDITFNLNNTAIISAVKIGTQIFCTTGDGEEAYQVYKKNDNENFWTKFDTGLSLSSQNSNLNLSNAFSFDTNNKIVLDAPFKNKIIHESTTDWTRNTVTGFFNSTLNLPNNIYQMFKSPFNNNIYCGKAESAANNVGFTVKAYKTNDFGSTIQLLNTIDYHHIIGINTSNNFIYKGNENSSNIYFYNAATNTSNFVANIDISNAELLEFSGLTNDNKIFLSIFNFSLSETTNILLPSIGFPYEPVNITFKPTKLYNNQLFGFYYDEMNMQYHLKKYDFSTNTETELAALPQWNGASALHTAQLFISGNVIYICNELHIYKSTDGGLNWVDFDSPFPTTTASRTFGIDNNGVLFAEYFNADDSSISGYYYWTDALSTSSFENTNLFAIYPNPTNGTINITGLKQAENVVVYNMLGQEVFSKKLSNTDQTIDISHLNSGSYFVKVSTSDVHQTIKLIKE